MVLSAQTDRPAIVYLHGFASSAGSTKAQFFKSQFEQAGFAVALPDLNVPSFEKMTLTAQLEAVQKAAEKIAGDRPIILMGSSLGGLLATIASEKMGAQKIDKLILLAPAFGIKMRWLKRLGNEAIEQWQKKGSRPFFHYAYGRDLELGFDFIKDLDNFETESPKVKVPTLVYHGVNDDSVPIDCSRNFSRENQPLVQLKEMADGHELIESMSAIWLDLKPFLQARV